MNGIRVPLSAGELLDKITILRIKAQRIPDAGKLENVHRELAALETAWRNAVCQPLTAEEAELTRVNEALWDIEDQIREQERRRDFGPRFIELARQVYFNNDARAAIKRRINLHLGSALMEEKSYANHTAATN